VLRRIVELVVVSGLVFAGLAVPGFVPAASEARADEGNAAVVEKVGASLVFIRTRFMGQVGVTDPDRPTVWWDTVIVTGQCTGYVVDPRGFIATAGHCVNGTDSEILNALRLKMVTEAGARFGKSTDWVRQAYRQSVAESWPVRGSETISEPIVEVSVRQPAGDSQVLPSWTDADVVSYQEFKAGDNAVLKISPVREIPALVVSGETPTPGDPVTSVGFPGAVQSNAGDGQVPQPSYKTGTVSSRQVDDSGVTRTEVSATMGSGMSGGPTVNSAGEVIGTNSSGTSLPDENDSFNFITDNLALRDYLSSHSVVLAQPEKREQRSVWIWLGPVLGALAAVIVLVLVALWLRRRRRRNTPVVPGMPIGAPPLQPQNPYGQHPHGTVGHVPWPGAVPASAHARAARSQPVHPPAVAAGSVMPQGVSIAMPGGGMGPGPWQGGTGAIRAQPPAAASAGPAAGQLPTPLWRGQAGPQVLNGTRPQSVPGAPSPVQVQPTVQVRVPAPPQGPPQPMPPQSVPPQQAAPGPAGDQQVGPGLQAVPGKTVVIARSSGGTPQVPGR